MNPTPCLLWVVALVAAGVRPAAAESQSRQSPRVATLIPAMAANPCAGRARYSVAGPSVAEVTRVTSVRSGRRQVVRTTLTFTNLGDQPIALGYKARSGSVIDDAGNRYANEGSDPNRVSGIGYVTASAAVAQLVLGPGQPRSASSRCARFGSFPWLSRI